VGSILADLLTRINRLSVEFATLTANTKSLDDVLQQLALAGTIISFCAKRKLSKIESMFDDSSALMFTTTHVQSQSCLAVELHNMTDCTLTQGWKLVVHINGGLCTEGDRGDHAASAYSSRCRIVGAGNQTISTDIHSLSPGHVKVATVDLKSFTEFPVKVSTALVYDVGIALKNDVVCKSLVISLDNHSVSIFSVLYPYTEGTGQNISHSGSPSNLSEILNRIAAIRRPDRYADVMREYQLTDLSSAVNSTNHKITLHLPPSIFHSNLPSYEVVFRWLFSDNPSFKTTVLNVQSVKVIMPNDVMLIFDISTVDSTCGCTLVVQCSSLSVLAQIQLAVSAKVKVRSCFLF